MIHGTLSAMYFLGHKVPPFLRLDLFCLFVWTHFRFTRVRSQRTKEAEE